MLRAQSKHLPSGPVRITLLPWGLRPRMDRRQSFPQHSVEHVCRRRNKLEIPMVVLTPDGVPVSVASISGGSHILVNDAVEMVTGLHLVLDDAHDLTLVEVGHLETLLNSLKLNIRRPCRNSDL